MGRPPEDAEVRLLERLKSIAALAETRPRDSTYLTPADARYLLHRLDVLEASEEVARVQAAQIDAQARVIEQQSQLLRGLDGYFAQYDAERTDGRTSPARAEIAAVLALAAGGDDV